MVANVGVLGPAGTYGEQAAIKYLGGKNAEYSYYDSHFSIISAVSSGELREGVVAVENMISGTVREVLDALYDSSPLVKQEIVLPISLCLARIPGEQRIERIISHPVAIDQVSRFIKKEHPGTKLEYTSSTASAMKRIADEGLKDAAGIGTEFSAKRYGLQVIRSNIEDFPGNQTRFFILSSQDAPFERSRDYKTLIAVRHDSDFPGLLFSALRPFAEAGINLTRIESRPTKKRLGSYRFFIEFTGHRDRHIMVLEELATIVKEVRVLGSYVADNS